MGNFLSGMWTLFIFALWCASISEGDLGKIIPTSVLLGATIFILGGAVGAYVAMKQEGERK